MIRHQTLAAGLLIVLALAACSVRQEQRQGLPAPQRTVVEALPSDARCRAIGRHARRDAQPAPLTIDPRRLGFPVEITCEAPGYFATTEILYPRPLPSVLYAAAEHLPLSAVTDISPAAGAPETSQVPFRIGVVLRAALFDTPGARDGFYEQIRKNRQAQWDSLRRRAEVECADPATSKAGGSTTSPPEICRRAFAWIAEWRDADLRRLEIDRRRATFR